MLNAAIIGAGPMGRWHLAAARAAGANVVAIVDPDLSAAALLAKRAPGAKVMPDLSDLDSLSVRVAHVCCATEKHPEVAVAVLEKGIAALIEKPIAPDAATTRVILDVAERNGALVCPVHQYAFQNGVRLAEATLPRMGKVRRMQLDFCSAGSDSGKVSPEALIDEILPHPLSILQHLRPDLPISELSWSVLAPEAGEFLASAFYGELIVSIYVSASARPPRVATQISCDRGTIEIDGFHGYAAILPGKVSRLAKLAFPFSRAVRHLGSASANLVARFLRGEFAYPGLLQLTRDFYSAIERNNPAANPISPEQIWHGALARDALRSAHLAASTAMVSA